jgi:hypothetical protein
MVAHASNPSYSGGRKWKEEVEGQPRQKVRNSISTTAGCGGVCLLTQLCRNVNRKIKIQASLVVNLRP